jgi:tetraacyldisaccharide 4'-kinase
LSALGNPPEFWQYGKQPPQILAVVSAIWSFLTARRVAKPGYVAGVPVVCCGNAGVGGSGKTPLSIDLATRLAAMGRHPALLTRGHGGARAMAGRVDPRADTAADVGDEALLLAEAAPTWRGANRAETARLALANGADVLILDDGLQNPSLVKTASLLVIDGGAGFGNGFVIPSGPLRESVSQAASRCSAAVLFGEDRCAALAQLPGSLPVLRVDLKPHADDLAALPPRLLAFAGIGRPEKFFATLIAAGHPPVETSSFPDHRPYTAQDIAALRARAAALGAGLVTTAKDYARLPAEWRDGIAVLRVRLVWQDEAAIHNLLNRILEAG